MSGAHRPDRHSSRIAVAVVLVAAVVVTVWAEDTGGAARSLLRRKGCYLGVATTSIDATAGKQLGLPDGVGLAVAYVQPGSPAGTTVRKHDVLHMLDDQILVNPEQLAVLVRSHKPGDRVELSILREGKKMTLTAALAAKALPTLRQAPHGLHRGNFAFPRMRPFPFGPSMPGLDNGAGEKIEERIRQHMKSSGMDGASLDDMLGEIRGMLGGRSATGSSGMQSGASSVDSSSVASSASLVDNEHSLTLTRQDGSSHLIARTSDGKVIFNGKIDTDELRAAVPREIAGKLVQLERMQGNSK